MMDKKSSRAILRMGIEEYALKTRNLHPVLYTQTERLLNKCAEENVIKISPENEIKLLLFQGIIQLSGKNKITKERVSNKGQKSDKFNLFSLKAKQVLKNIPKNKRIEVKFDKELFLKSLRWAWVWITPWKCLPSGRISSEKVSMGKKALNKITKTPCFMFLRFQMWGRGILNKPGFHCGNCFDLATSKGFALLLHEIYHIYQFRRNPLKLLWQYIKAIKDSFVLDKVFFSHRRITFEIEAIAFQQHINEALNKGDLDGFCSIFKKYR